MNNVLTFAVAAAFAVSAQAQDKPKAPPIWHQGKPPAMQESKLAPHAGKMTETPASEIPIDKLKLPPGFKAEIWASGLPGGFRATLAVVVLLLVLAVRPQGMFGTVGRKKV